MSTAGRLQDRATAISEWAEEEQADPRHHERNATILGIALGVLFTTCFLTGVLSHLIQHPPGWFTWVSRPAGTYRVTQGVHVAAGIASIPVLLGKLWVVYPHLWARPIVRDLRHLVERLALVPLVAGGLFMVMTGLANIDLWYPWPFFFPAGHYWVAWITIGALVAHIGAKASISRRAITRRPAAEDPNDQPGGAGDRDRRQFLVLVGAGAAVMTVATIGQTVFPLRKLALLAPRRPDIGVQGFPVNRTAVEAAIDGRADPSAYRLTVERGGQAVHTFTLEDLRGLPARTAELPIACVEGWSASRTWTGVPVRAVMAAAGITGSAEVRVESLERTGRYRSSELNHLQVADPDTLLAFEVDGAPLAPDHGAPVRLIAPNRPGVLQTKWVERIVVL